MSGRRRSIFASAVAAALATSSAGPVFAETRIAVPCPNGVPCSMQVVGHIDMIGSAQIPWTASVVVPAGVCLYANVLKPDAAALVSFIGPDGSYKSGAISSTGVSPTVAGWYTIHVDSTPPAVEQIFTLNLGLDAASRCNYKPPL